MGKYSARKIEAIEKAICEEYTPDMSITALAAKHGTTTNRVHCVIKQQIMLSKSWMAGTTVAINSKQEPYFTEQELITGYVPPRIEDLKGEELEILNSLI